MIEELKKEVDRITDQIIGWRRDFHRHPEVAFQEERTSSVIKTFLESLDIPVTVSAKTGLRGVLEGKPGGRTVALRADIDALPLKEEAVSLMLNPEMTWTEKDISRRNSYLCMSHIPFCCQ